MSRNGKSFRRTGIAALLAIAAASGTIVAVNGTAVADPAPPAATGDAPVTDAPNPDFGSTGQGAEVPVGTEVRGTPFAAAGAATKISRETVIERARSWVGIGLDYNWGGRHGGYRTDCSGYVSMAWDLDSSLTTDTFEPRGVVHRIGKSDLKAGDALLDNDGGAGGHVVLFERWANSDHTKYWGFDFTPSGVHHRIYDYPYYPGYGPYHRVRYKNIVDDATPKPQPSAGMTDLVAANINGDAVDDVVGVEASTGKLWLYKGNGNGTIAAGSARVEIGSGGWNGMHDLVGMDVDNDGKTDVVGAESSSGKLFFYKSDGSGLETRKEIGSAGWNGMNDLIGGDFTSNAYDDLVGVEKSTGKLYLYPGTGSGLGDRKVIGSGGW
ncbi:VCBS repeat-containing protein [Streptomyces sp. BR123]|uniref:C40 family peptidase n=1 Tax=Streptomyces sp. BR123 TaxID=2749828 RepID=UPI0015C47BE8|nr:VCBS repeat-containing protein [Streptomyces sp. BR123]NXY98451.1 VCBS repeat-containing protein [Streptomyces sp. BR123]